METNATATVRHNNYSAAFLPLFPAIPKSQVSVATDAYRMTYGKEPRGAGCWWFQTQGDFVVAVSHCSYAEAKKVAVAKAAECGLAGWLEVMT